MPILHFKTEQNNTFVETDRSATNYNYEFLIWFVLVFCPISSVINVIFLFLPYFIFHVL